MDSTQASHLCRSIAEIVRDYRLDEISPITAEHVARWVYQFEPDARLTILQEMRRILGAYYVSREKTELLLAAMLRSPKLFGQIPGDSIRRTAFLNIQRNGRSQRDLLALAKNVVLKEYGIRLLSLSQPDQYMYLDECLFSGNTALYDIKNWLRRVQPTANLKLVFWAEHSAGRRYLEAQLGSLPQLANINVEIHSMQRFRFQNDLAEAERYDCLWPRATYDDESVNEYVQLVTDQATYKRCSPRLFRPESIPTNETVFSSPQARHIVEQAFLKAGARIVGISANQKPQMRPMGYEVLESLGFGAFFVTYRNIANNCPLALWWGDPEAPRGHPFRKWRPLFLRKANQS